MRKRVLEIMDKGGFVIDLWLLSAPETGGVRKASFFLLM